MAQNQPLVTIITNTKNRANLISRCIESIQRQTYQNYEHIIADGGTDNTEEVVLSYNDPKIRYVKVPGGGPIAQTKEAFLLSKGNYITFLDDDDEYLPEKLEKQLELIESLPDDYFIYGSMTYYDNVSKKELRIHKADLEGGKEILPIAISKPVICGTPTLMFSRKIFESIGGTWISGIGNDMSDWALVCKALSQGWKVAALKDSFLKIYINHSAVRMSDPIFYKDNSARYIKFHSYFISEYADIIRQYPKSGIYHYRMLVRYCLMCDRYHEAFVYWGKLLKINPSFKSLALLPFSLWKKLLRKL